MAYDPLSLLAPRRLPVSPVDEYAQSLLGYQRTNPLSGLSGMPDMTDATLLQPTQQVAQQPRGFLAPLQGMLTGPGSSARLQALGAALLSGPSRTPISFGSQLAKGLLAGTQLAEEQKQAEFKRGLLEAEMDLAKRKQAREEAKTGLLDGDIYNVVDKDGKVVRQVIGGTQSYLDAVNDPNTTLSKIGTYSQKPTDLKGYDVYELQEDGSTKIIGTFSGAGAEPYLGRPGYRVTEMGAGLKGGVADQLAEVKLSQDTVISPDGKVTVLEGSPTQIKLGLQKGQLTLSLEKFNELIRKNKADEALAEQRLKLQESEFQLKYDEAQRNLANEQKLEERQKEAFFQSTWDIANQTDLIIQKAEQFGPENVFGPASVVGKVPVIGASSAQGEVRAQIEELQSKLVKQALDDFRMLSKQGATGFGQLSQQELEIVMKKFINLNLERAPQEILKDLKDLSNQMKSISYGVIVDGKFEAYKPSKHANLISSGRAIPATPENKKFVGAPKGPEGTVFDTFLKGSPVFIDPKTGKRFTTSIPMGGADG